MIIEVTGTGTRNKGAELMLIAIRQYFAARHPEVKLAVDRWFGTYEDRAKYQLYLLNDLEKWGRARLGMELLPATFCRQVGIVQPDEVSAILDASGFAFGDQHPPERANAFVRKLAKAKAAGQKLILLPQALGPFEKKDSRDSFRAIAELADLIFTRDRMSLEYAQVAALGQHNIQLAPDFTNLIKPPLTINSSASDVVCIVPNERMIEKAESDEAAQGYIRFLHCCIGQVKEMNLTPIMMVHSAPDEALAQTVIRKEKSGVAIVRETNPVEIKRVLGESRLVIASRFHAIVSALSQGVPTLGTSWSHKYEMLFEDYDSRELLLPTKEITSEYKDHLADVFSRALQMRTRIQEKAQVEVGKAQRMWDVVERVLFS